MDVGTHVMGTQRGQALPLLEKTFLITILSLCTGADFSLHETLSPNEEDLGQ